MQDVIIDGSSLEPKLREAIVKQFDDILGRTYSNPVRDAIDEEIKKSDGAIKKMVADLLAEILTNEKFKTSISEELIKKILVRGLGN